MELTFVRAQHEDLHLRPTLEPGTRIACAHQTLVDACGQEHMALLFDTAELPAHRRRQVLMDTLCSTAASLEVAVPRGPDVKHRFDGWRLGRAYLHLSTGSALRLIRTPELIRRAPEELVSFTFLLRGQAFHRQGDYVHTDCPGRVSVIESSRPWESRYAADGQMGSVSIGVEDLGLPLDLIRRAAAPAARGPVHDLFAAHLEMVSRSKELLVDPWQAEAVGAATVELARALLAGACPDHVAAANAMHSSLLARVEAYLEQHLTEHDLCPERIAYAQGISVRQLYKAWPADRPSLGRTILTARLEGARCDLESPDRGRLAIGVIAARWGFTDPAHFSRRFRAAHGVSPREYREMRPSTHPARGD